MYTTFILPTLHSKHKILILQSVTTWDNSELGVELIVCKIISEKLHGDHSFGHFRNDACHAAQITKSFA